MKELRRHAYKPPFSMRRNSNKEDRIDKIERNLINLTNNYIDNVEIINVKFNQARRLFARLGVLEE